MTPISATESGRDTAGGLAMLEELLRLAGHVLRNSLNGAAVNTEVVRSRISKGRISADLGTFASRAAGEVDRASDFGSGIAALARIILLTAAGGERNAAARTGSDQFRVDGLPGDYAVPPELDSLAKCIGVSIERDGSAVIFKGSALVPRNPNTEA